MLRAGAGRADISPPVGIAHAGWGAQTHQVSDGNDMPLYVTALTLSSPSLRAVIVDIDIAVLTVEQDSEIRSLISSHTGIRPNNIRISYSHTHSAPVTFSDWMTEGMELVEAWLDALPGKCVEAVEAAIAVETDAVPSFGRGECDININRRPADARGELFTGRNWDGYVDRSVEVVGLDDHSGAPIATLVNYACHPTIMGHENRWVTPDFPGPMRRVVEQTVGGTCLFLQGASGNQGPVNGFTGDLGVYRKAGALLGAEASRVRLTIDPFDCEERLVEILPSGADLGIYEDVPVGDADTTLAVSWIEMELPSKDVKPLGEAQADFERLSAELESARRSGTTGDALQGAVSLVMRANIAMNVSKNSARHRRGDAIPVSVQAIRIGPAVLVAMPVEPFAELGAAIKARSPAAGTVFSGFSNGHYAYLPTDMAHEEGGYEVRVSPFGAGAEGIAVQACLSAIDEVWESSR